MSVQSMLNTDTRAVAPSLEQIRRLADAGCDLVRLAVPDPDAAIALKAICASSPLPVIADIHYDYRLALSALRAGVDAIRINPGNMPQAEGLREVARLARKRRVPIRVGVNSGSIAPQVRRRFGGVNADSLACSALYATELLEAAGFDDICISAKTPDPALMIETYRLLAEAVAYPLHLGVTEAGTVYEGVIRSAVGLGALLSQGIGDTIRVSLTADPEEEVRAGLAVLRALGLRQKGVRLISCPTCGRTQVDLIPLAAALEEALKSIDAPLTVALMGCPVNGPGEARDADVGLAGGDGYFLLFRKGEVIRRVPEGEALETLIREVRALADETDGA